jgi:hypothetical protein
MALVLLPRGMTVKRKLHEPMSKVKTVALRFVPNFAQLILLFYSAKSKDKIIPVHAMKAYGEVEMSLHSFLIFALHVLSGQCHIPVALPHAIASH